MSGIGARRGLAIATCVLGLLTVAFGGVLWRGKKKRSVAVVEEGVEELGNADGDDDAGVSLFMKAWGSRWWENEGRGLWQERGRVRGDGGV